MIDAADHLNFAARRENAERIAFILTSDDRRHLAERESASTGSRRRRPRCRDRPRRPERRAASSPPISPAPTSPALGLAVCRVIVPGYQPLNAGHALRPLGGDRLYEVPQKLGYRGIARGSAGNPAPHPFR